MRSLRKCAWHENSKQSGENQKEPQYLRARQRKRSLQKYGTEWQHKSKKENMVSQSLRKICFQMYNVASNVKFAEKKTEHLL